METSRSIEIFSAGCPACEDAIALINRIACSSCHIEVLDMHQATNAAKAKQYGISRLPAVVIDGQLADCCTQSIDEDVLRAMGLGQAS
jgi:glutaredoxin 3